MQGLYREASLLPSLAGQQSPTAKWSSIDGPCSFCVGVEHKMATRPDPLAPAAFGIDTVGVLTRRVSPGQGLVKEVKVSLARVRFGEELATMSDPAPKKSVSRPRLKPSASPRRIGR